MNEEIKSLLSSVYHDPQNGHSYSTVDKLWQGVGRRISRKLVEEYLQGEDTYSLYKPARRRYKRSKMVVSNINDLWQSDLCDLQTLKRFNKGVRYVLCVIDTFSRFAYVRPLKTKQGSEVTKQFASIVKDSGVKPIYLSSDMGTEYTSKEFQNFLKKKKIKFYTNAAPVKAAMAERFIRSFKMRLFKFFESTNSHTYVDKLQDIVTGYNSSFHVSIGRAPSDVNESNVLKVWQYQHKKPPLRLKAPKYVVGQHVRLNQVQEIFAKGYKKNWTDEVFVIHQAIKRTPPVYRVKDSQGEVITGLFYEQELQLVLPQKVYKINKILKRRVKKGRREVFVNWLGHAPSFNSWILEKDIQKL